MNESTDAFRKLLTQLSTIVKNLDQDKLAMIDANDAKLQLIVKGQQVIDPINFADLAQQVRRVGDQAGIIKLLSADKRLNLAALKELAFELNIDLPSAAKSKEKAQLHLAQSVTAFRERSLGQH